MSNKPMNGPIRAMSGQIQSQTVFCIDVSRPKTVYGPADEGHGESYDCVAIF